MEGLEHTFQTPRFASTLFKEGRVAEETQEHYRRTEIGESEGGQEGHSSGQDGVTAQDRLRLTGRRE